MERLINSNNSALNLNSKPTIVYKIDENFRITFVDSAWNIFTKESNGYEIISDKVIGKNLFNFIYSKDVKQIYREIIACVKNGKTIKFPFRCDSPTHVRNFFMTINLDEEKKVTFTSEFLSENLRETPLKAIYSTNISEEYMLVMCSWCKKVKTQAGWLELEEVLNKEKIFIKREIPQISHGICEECYSVIKSEISKQE